MPNVGTPEVATCFTSSTSFVIEAGSPGPLERKTPSGFIATRLLGTGLPNPDFLRPQNYSGDFQQPEQRVGQVGFRFVF